MKIYDVSQEVFTSNVYPGDPVPVCEKILRLEKGDACNLSLIHMCAHSGTHVDSPKHFYDSGKTIEQVELSHCIGSCSVRCLSGHNSDTIIKILKTCHKRLLIKGDFVVTLSMASLFIKYGIILVGVEGQSVGPADAPKPVHLELLGRDVVLLEGLVLDEVPEGDYFLSAAPLKLGGSDGAPCRAVLLEFDKT